MSIPHTRKGRHAAPARPTRRLAIAAALAAGATPLVCAGTAVAATAEATATTSAPPAGLSELGLPDMALPLGLPYSLGSMTVGLPLVQEVPVNDVVNDVMPPLGEVVQVGDLGLIPHRAAQPPLVRSAPLPLESTLYADGAGLNTASLTTAADRALTDGAQRTAQRLAAALPLANIVPQLASASDGPLQLAPQVLHEGALGTLNSGVAPQVTDLAGGLIGQTAPLVSQLRRSGVPTVGDVTARLSATELPVVGTVGSLTQTLPVTTVLGTQSPVTGALQSLSGL